MESPTIYAEAELRGQAQIWRHTFSFVDSAALSCAVELRLADIIHSNGPISPSRLASFIKTDDDTPPDVASLARIMRLLAHRKIFTASQPPPSSQGEPLYGPTECSRWLLRDAELTLAPLILLQAHPSFTGLWHCLGSCVTRGGSAYASAHGHEMWEMAARDREFNDLFGKAMECTAKITVRAVLAGYGDGLGPVEGTLVDVGGGTGVTMEEIVKAFPRIEGVSFDLPHVVAAAPIRRGVTHVGGDMFEAIPKADVVMIQWTMHNWGDEDCVKILKNIRRAISGNPEGKVIIVDVVVKEDGEEEEDIFEYGTSLVYDLMMMAYHQGGKERTEAEWKSVLERGGFPHYNIIKIKALQSIIEAFPQ